MKKNTIYGTLIATTIAALVMSCSATRYIPQNKYLLAKNEVKLHSEYPKIKDIVTTSDIEKYIKQRPNSKIFGIGMGLGFYNLTDSSKHDWWHKFWGTRLGSKPVIFDSMSMLESNKQILIYMQSKGFLNATISDSVEYKAYKATVDYNVQSNLPYTISYVNYNIEDPFIREILMSEPNKGLIRVGNIYDRSALFDERNRITKELRNIGFYYFGNSSISYSVDSSWNDNTVSVQVNIKRLIADYTPDRQPVYSNHSIYRISRIIVNTDFDPTKSIEQNTEYNCDTLVYQGIEILYHKKMYIKPEVLVSAIRLSPNALFDQTSVQRTSENIQALGFNSSILFTPLPVDSAMMTYVTIPTKNNEDVSTTEQQLECLIQCTPTKRQSFTQGLEASTTASYSSIALTLGYQNRNLLGGAENFTVNLRGAYEFVKNPDKNNSYELGVTTSLSIPRFLLPIKNNRLSQIRQRSTKITANYNIQERPDYNRTIIGGSFGYNWLTKNGGRFTVNPVDLHVINVPWISTQFLNSIDNPFLKDSYQSQMIAGMSASYYRNSNIKIQESGNILRIMMDANGNLISALDGFLTKYEESKNEKYYTLFGLRFAQYVRASFDYSRRHTLNDHAQLAWRIFIGAGLPYGNSSTIPFERLFFAGGSNSMRGWQIRTLGPGSTPQVDSTAYPNQLGDMRLEANIEFRYKLWGGLNMAVFLDAGNIWMNSKGRLNDQSNFRFNTFYKQIALNTGAGLRWDFDFFLLRLDWGLKLHSPNLPEGQRWFKQMGFADSAFHFAIGLPF